MKDPWVYFFKLAPADIYVVSTNDPRATERRSSLEQLDPMTYAGYERLEGLSQYGRMVDGSV